MAGTGRPAHLPGMGRRGALVHTACGFWNLNHGRRAKRRALGQQAKPADSVGNGPDRAWHGNAKIDANDPLRIPFDLGQQEQRGALLPSGIRIVLRRRLAENSEGAAAAQKCYRGSERGPADSQPLLTLRRDASARLAQEAGQAGKCTTRRQNGEFTLAGHASWPGLEVTANEALDALAAGNRDAASI